MTLASTKTIVAPVWSQQCTKTIPTVYMAGEGGDQAFAQRYRAWEKYHMPETTKLVYADNVPLLSEDEDLWVAYCETILEFQYEIGLVVLDTVGRVLAGEDDNSRKTTSLYDNRARLIANHFDCLVLGLGHSGHEKPNRELGSVGFGADADVRIKISKPSKYLVELEMFKQKDWDEWEEKKHFKLAEVTLGDKMQLAVTHVDQSQLDHTNIQKAATLIALASEVREEVRAILMARSGAVAYTAATLSKMVADTIECSDRQARTYIKNWHNDPEDTWLKERWDRAVKTYPRGTILGAYKVFNYHPENNTVGN